MNRRLVDVNVWLAILVYRHEHHELARRWFDSLQTGEASMCRFVQLALIRLLGNRSVMGADAISASEAWILIQSLLEDERVEFALEPQGIDACFPEFLRYRVPTSRLIGDVYLAAFAVSGSYVLATLDRGFDQFRELNLELLAR